MAKKWKREENKRDGRMEVLQLWAAGVFVALGLGVWLVDDILWTVAIVHHHLCSTILGRICLEPFFQASLIEQIGGLELVLFVPFRKLAMGSRAGGDS